MSRASRLSLAVLVGALSMSDREMADIIAFLESLTDPAFARTIPERVPSGLPLGGGALSF